MEWRSECLRPVVYSSRVRSTSCIVDSFRSRGSCTGVSTVHLLLSWYPSHGCPCKSTFGPLRSPWWTKQAWGEQGGGRRFREEMCKGPCLKMQGPWSPFRQRNVESNLAPTLHTCLTRRHFLASPREEVHPTYSPLPQRLAGRCCSPAMRL